MAHQRDNHNGGFPSLPCGCGCNIDWKDKLRVTFRAFQGIVPEEIRHTRAQVERIEIEFNKGNY